MERRSFIEMFVAGAVGFSGISKDDLLVGNQINWRKISEQYPDSSSNILNLNNGSAGMMAKDVEDQLLKFVSQVNRNPPYEKAIYWDKLVRQSKNLLSKMIEATPEELALVRNTTEALNYVFAGYEIPKGGNVVCAHHDYTHAIDALKKLSVERSFKLRMVDIKLPMSEDQIVDAYKKLITDNTAMVLVTSMTHREGQIMPVKEITKLAKAKGAKVIVDAAHAIGQYKHSVKDWDCDFYCTSLHKWLGGPLGTGLLYMKKHLIPKVKGSYGADEKLNDKMVKFEVVGTKLFALPAAVLSSLRFHNKIGVENKHNRLMELTDYWVAGVKGIPMLKTIVPEKYGAIANFHFPGPSNTILSFFESKSIHLKKVRPPNGNRTTYRVSPNIYHDFEDMDRFIDAMHEFSKRI